ncbi:MAG: NUDIX domain-containing protein [Candidatus Nanopelagicales bacterium]|nr:NUDIX domain-containing protein [Candidatus Nanopelagicales bacterium]
MGDPARVEQFAGEIDGWTVSASGGQRALHDQYRMLLKSDPSSLSREREHGHFTASALIVDPLRSSVLLVMHPRVRRWLQMGGHIEPGDASFRDAALRECTEESGYCQIEVGSTPARFDRHDVPCKSARGEVVQSVHWDVQFLAVVDSQSECILTEDAPTRWWDLGSAMPELDYSVKQLIDTAREAFRL